MDYTQIILDYLSKNYPQIGVCFFIAFVVGFCVWKLAKFYFETKVCLRDMPEIKELLKKISTGFNALNKILLENSLIKTSCFSDTNSPRKINELGEKVLIESGGNNLFLLIEPELMIEMNKKNYNSFLEVEENSLNVLMNKMSDSRFSQVQNFVYNNPKYEGKNLTYADILLLLSLKLRDDYLKEHPLPEQYA